MTESQKLETMVSENLMGNCGGGGFEEKGSEEISVSNHVNGFQYTAINSDSLVLDMERLEKDINSNSIIKLQRSLSRKGTFRGAEKKTISNKANERNISPRAALHGGGTPEKPLIVAAGGGDNSINPPVHNQITIMNGSMGNTDVESKFVGKRLSFRRSSPSRTIDPRRILLFFATLKKRNRPSIGMDFKLSSFHSFQPTFLNNNIMFGQDNSKKH